MQCGIENKTSYGITYQHDMTQPDVTCDMTAKHLYKCTCASALLCTKLQR